jgi:hypothetical protein
MLVGANAAFLVNPLGIDIFTYPFATVASSAQHSFILEWQRPPWGVSPLPQLVALAVVITGLALLDRERRWSPAAITIAAVTNTILSLQAARYLLFAGPFIAIAFTPPALRALASLGIAQRVARSRGAIASTFAGLILASALILAGATRPLVPGYLDATFPRNPHFPFDAAHFLTRARCTGKVFNNYGWGGYLAWTWRQPVGAYGAADALGDERLQEFIDVQSLRRDPEEYFASEEITLLVMPIQSALGVWAYERGWRLLHKDPVAVILAAPGTSPCAGPE